MPYLNWKEQAGVKQQIESVAATATGEKRRLTLSLESLALGELLPFLRETYPNGDAASGELRLDLPRNWIVFWKKREGESRLLLAHPQPDEWVATVALSAQDGRKIVERLENFQAGQRLDFAEHAAVGGLSNLELVLVHVLNP